MTLQPIHFGSPHGLKVYTHYLPVGNVPIHTLLNVRYVEHSTLVKFVSEP